MQVLFESLDQDTAPSYASPPLLIPAASTVADLGALLSQLYQPAKDALLDSSFDFFLKAMHDDLHHHRITDTLQQSTEQLGLRSDEQLITVYFARASESKLVETHSFDSPIKCIRMGFVGLFDGTVQSLDGKFKKKVHTGAVSALAMCGTAIVSGSLDCTLRTTEGGTTKTLHTFEQTVQCISIQGTSLAVGLWDGSVSFADLSRRAVSETKTTLLAHPLHKSPVVYVDQWTEGANGSTTLLTASWDHTVRTWTNFEQAAVATFGQSITCGARMSSELYAFGYPDGRLRLVDRHHLRASHTVNGHRGRVSSITSTGRHLVTAGDDGMVHWWSVQQSSGTALLEPQPYRSVRMAEQGAIYVDFHGDLLWIAQGRTVHAYAHS